MKLILKPRSFATLLPLLLPLLLSAQQVINSLPIRAFGSATVTPIVNVSPNFPEGREFWQPSGIAIDPASGYVYVSDTRNNRVLGFTDYLSFANGAQAALVVGQADFISTLGASANQRSDALNLPSGVAVDGSGNLYVVDIGNRRIVRFPRPFENWGGVGTRLAADFVIGQADLTSSALPPVASLTASTLRLPTTAVVSNTNNLVGIGIAFDNQGNLWVPDYDNHRVLRYPAASLGSGASNGPAADLVLGQVDFTTRTVPSASSSITVFQDKTTTRFPRGVAFIPDSNLLAVTDGRSRVLVYQNPSANNQPATRILGIPTTAQIQGGVQVAANVLSAPVGVFAATSNRLGVVDSGNHRVVVYPPIESWTPETPTQFSPSATALAGQENLGDREPNRGQGTPNDNGYFAPFAAVAAQGKVLVVDTLNHRVLRQSLGDLGGSPADGVLGQSNFGANAPNRTDGKEVNQPFGMAFDYSTDPPRVYVADTGNHRVLGFRSVVRMRNGEVADVVIGQPNLTTAVINYPSGDTESPTATGLFNPVSVAVDGDGNVWVADGNNGRLLRFPKPDFDNPPTLPSAEIVLGQSSFTSKSLTATQNTMRFPSGVVVSPVTGSVIASDQVHNRVLVFQQPLASGMSATKAIGQGSFVTSDSGAGSNRFNSPRGLGVDSANRLYVADFSNNRVQIFDNVDSLVPLDATAGISLTQGFAGQTLSQPEGIAVDRQNGEVWVTEAGRNRVLRYPEWSALFFNPNANFFVSTIGGAGNRAISVAIDPLGFPLVGEISSRIVFYVPRLATANGATFFTAAPNAPSAGQPSVGHLAPNTIASAFSFIGNFDTTREIPTAGAVAIPLPTELSDLEITLDGRPLPLFFVSQGQINFFLPNDVPQSGVVVIDVRRKSTGDLLAGDFVGMDAVAPGFFTTNQQGIGQVAAINNMGQTATGPNGPSNPLVRGQVISLFGTGFGFVPGAPNDGSAVAGALSTPDAPLIGTEAGFLQGEVQYSGFAPGFVGLWQINVRIPDNVAPSNAAPIVIFYRGKGSTDGVRDGQVIKIQTTFALRQP
jgi:uncharacterized protein (TIGR03437 family)